MFIRLRIVALSVGMLALAACQSKKEALQFACDAPKAADSGLPAGARGQALAAYIEKNVKNDEVLTLLGGDAPRAEKAVKLAEMATAEGVAPCELAELWARPPITMPLMPPSMASAMPPLSGSAPIAPGLLPPHAPNAIVETGSVDLAKIQVAVDAATDPVTECYKQGLRRNRKLEGSLRIRFTIGTEGKVTKAEEIGRAFPDEQVCACVADVFLKMTFDKPAGGEAVITYPIALRLGLSAPPAASD